MHTWAALEAAEPRMAATAHRLFWIPGVGLGYLATLRRDGAPRIHPVNLAGVEGRLVCFIGPSPKLGDLRRDGRYALHAPGSDTENDEIEITGRAVERNADEPFRASAVAGLPAGIPPVATGGGLTPRRRS